MLDFFSSVLAICVVIVAYFILNHFGVSVDMIALIVAVSSLTVDVIRKIIKTALLQVFAYFKSTFAPKSAPPVEPEIKLPRLWWLALLVPIVGPIAVAAAIGAENSSTRSNSPKPKVRFSFLSNIIVLIFVLFALSAFTLNLVGHWPPLSSFLGTLTSH